LPDLPFRHSDAPQPRACGLTGFWIPDEKRTFFIQHPASQSLVGLPWRDDAGTL